MPTVDFTQYDLITNVLAQGAQNPQPYPPFTGDDETAYAAACALWGVDDIRSQYWSLTFDLDAHTQFLTPQYYPGDSSGFSLDVWKQVCAQLSTEIAAVGDVRALYSTFNGFNTVVFVNQQANLTLIQTGLTLADTADTPLWPGALVEGIFYAIFSALGPVGAFIANVVSAAWNTALAAGTWNPTQQLTVEYQNLLTTLLANWNAVTKTAAAQETAILQDWGMTQAVSQLCANQLSIDPQQLQNAENIGEAQFNVIVMQTMMPTVCAITGTMFGTGAAPSSTTNNWVFYAQNGTWCEFALVMDVDNYSGAVPSSLLDTYVWGAGVSRQDIFLAQNGWLLPYDNVAINGWYGSFSTDSDSALLVFFMNNTPVDLLIKPASSNADQTELLTEDVLISSNQFGMFAAAYHHGPSLDFGVWFGGYGGGSVASCTVSETVDTLEGGTVSVSNANWVDNFYLTSVTVNGNWGSGDNGAPGVAVLNIRQN